MSPYLWSSVAVLALFVLVWIGSVVLRDASLVDRFWGIGFLVIAGTSILTRGSVGPAGLASAVAVALWGVRLSIYLTWRNWGHGEDRRYTDMRKRIGPRFWWVSLFSVFVLQSILGSIVSLPVQSSLGNTRALGPCEWVGLGVFALGFVLEVVADTQLAIFLRSPHAKDAVMDRGLWGWSRHPNYFGEALLWWGLGILGVRGQLGFWALAGPLVITGLLLKVSGVTLLEKSIGKRRPGYDEYVRRTSAFIPWPPKR